MFGKRIADGRKSKNMTQIELAEKGGNLSIYAYENRERTVPEC